MNPYLVTATFPSGARIWFRVNGADLNDAYAVALDYVGHTLATLSVVPA